MATIASDSPMGQALQERVLPKLMELGWSSGEQDDTLAEYIVLMLANGNNEQQIATELSTDLFNSEPDDPAPANFAKWLFEQIRELEQIHGGHASPTAPTAQLTADAPTFVPSAPAAAGDAEMGDGADGTDASNVIPTGPKSMRNGAKSGSREKRMVGGINKSLDRSTDDPLRRVRGAAGSGRINSHSREPPKGPRQTNVQRGLQAVANGRGAGMMNMPPMGPGGPMQQMPYPQQNGGQVVMDANQMQQMMHMMERQAAMLAQMNNNMNSPTNFQGHGRSLGDRVERGGGRGRGRGRGGHHGGSRNDQQSQNGDAEMGEDGQPKEGENGEEQQPRDITKTMCKYNKFCNNPECPYAHAGPNTYTGINVDPEVECSHGAACTNARCTSRHPSPAKKMAFQASMPCKYGPLCTKPGCPFFHEPNNGPCKNGADCTVEGCQFWHNPVKCKFPQCTNRACPYKHEQGQKRGYFKSRQLVLDAEGNPIKEPEPAHVSERTFVPEGEEEYVQPGGPEVLQQDMDVVA